MPAYNAEKFVSASIESVLAQTFGDFELLVVDDASTDGTAAIVESYVARDSRVRLLRHEQNKGVAGALNTGLAAARGKYIARADADDLNRPYRFDHQVAFLESHPRIFLVGGGYAPFNEEGHRLDAFHPTDSLEIAWRFVTNTYFCHPTVVFRREVYEALGGYPAVEAEDFAYFSRVVRRFPCANLPEILIDYRETLGNRSNSAKERIAKSVETQSRDNYSHYVGNAAGFTLFFSYQNGHALRLKDWFRVERDNGVILRRIAEAYGVSRWSFAFWRTRTAILRDGLRRVIGPVIRILRKAI